MNELDLEQEIEKVRREIDEYDEKIITKNKSNTVFKGRYMTSIHDDFTEELKHEREKKFWHLLKLVDRYEEIKKEKESQD